MRSDAREVALKVLFAENFGSDNLEELKNALTKNLKPADAAFAETLLDLVRSHKAELIQEIDSHIFNFKENRLYNEDKCILLIAIAEIKYLDDIPPVVSVNEAVNLATKYSTQHSPDFINGLLAGVINP